MSSFCLCSDMITAEYLYSYAALSLCTIIVRNRESCKITVRFAMHRILADCTNSRGMSRACLKKAFRELRVPVCGRFYPNEGGVAGYGNRMRAKYTIKWGLQIAEMIFQTCSGIRRTVTIFLFCIFRTFILSYFPYFVHKNSILFIFVHL